MTRLVSKSGHKDSISLFFAAVLLAFFYAAPDTVIGASSKTTLIGGVTPEQALRLGEKMYRDGILPSGKPLQGMVQGDIPVEGTKFTCANCHQRSGFGGLEGTVRTVPIDGTRLYSSISNFKGVPLKKTSKTLKGNELYRPAYTDETLARVMRTGEDPTGKQIFNTMPKYFLDENDMAILVYYLKHLSTDREPGVTDESLQFATVITDEVSKEARDAMLAPLQSFIDHWRISKNMEFMVRKEAFIQEGTFIGVKKLSLVVWELKGPEDTWRQQLEERYKKTPVFALLGGITTKEWAPIHRFCEDHEIPAVFPITNFPVISETDWYTLYLSKGLYQEGETAAKYLNTREDLLRDLSVVQVFRKDRSGLALSKAFQATWIDLGRKEPENVALDGDEQLTAEFWKKLAENHKRAVVLIWLDANDFPDLGILLNDRSGPGIVFASSSLLGKRLYSLPEKARPAVYLTYPYTLPQNAGNYKPQVEALLKNNSGGANTHQFIEYKILSLQPVLNGPLSRMRNYVYRDYFMEIIDELADVSVIPVPFPRLSFGSGQRYASKGCYIVQVGEGPQPGLISRSDWVIH